jgi:hypothetical protein
MRTCLPLTWGLPLTSGLLLTSGSGRHNRPRPRRRPERSAGEPCGFNVSRRPCVSDLSNVPADALGGAMDERYPARGVGVGEAPQTFVARVR